MGAVMTDRVVRYLELVSAERGEGTLEELCQRVGGGEGLPAICAAWDVPYARVLTWLMADAKRYERYLRALEVAAHALVAQAVPLSDEAASLVADGAKPAAVTAKALQIDTRFRAARHHAAKLYGEVEAQGKPLANVHVAIGVRVASVVPQPPAIEGEIANGLEDGDI